MLALHRATSLEYISHQSAWYISAGALANALQKWTLDAMAQDLRSLFVY